MAEYFNINYEFSPLKVVERIDEILALDRTGYICVADGNVLQMVHKDAAYRTVVGGSMFSICDSGWVPLYLKCLYGLDVPQYCGSRIFEDLVESRKYRMLFLGTSNDILVPLKANLSTRFDPRIAEMKFVELPFLKVEEFDYPAIAEMINADRPDIIWVALGAPKQEQFMNCLKPYLDRGVMIAVGAVFKFYSGIEERRAPEWVIKCHLEFFYRIFQDPEKQMSRCRDILVTLPSVLLEEVRRKKKINAIR